MDDRLEHYLVLAIVTSTWFFSGWAWVRHAKWKDHRKEVDEMLDGLADLAVNLAQISKQIIGAQEQAFREALIRINGTLRDGQIPPGFPEGPEIIDDWHKKVEVTRYDLKTLDDLAEKYQERKRERRAKNSK